jgi:hypothetical protein
MDVEVAAVLRVNVYLRALPCLVAATHRPTFLVPVRELEQHALLQGSCNVQLRAVTLAHWNDTTILTPSHVGAELSKRIDAIICALFPAHIIAIVRAEELSVLRRPIIPVRKLLAVLLARPFATVATVVLTTEIRVVIRHIAPSVSHPFWHTADSGYQTVYRVRRIVVHVRRLCQVD